MAIDQIDAGHITNLMLSIEAVVTPKKTPVVLAIISRIFAYALAYRLTRTNPAQGLSLRDMLKPMPKVQHHAAIVNASELAELIKAIDETDVGYYCTVEALKLIPRVFLRPKEIRGLKCDYIDFDGGLIRVPEEDMTAQQGTPCANGKTGSLSASRNAETHRLCRVCFSQPKVKQ